MNIEKRSQVGRANIALTLVMGIWEELLKGECEDAWELLKPITNLQVFVNRCNWKLNHLAFDDEEGEK